MYATSIDGTFESHLAPTNMQETILHVKETPINMDAVIYLFNYATEATHFIFVVGAGF